MAGTKILGSLAGILLASVMVSASSAAVPVDMCPREQAEVVRPIAVPATEALPAAGEETKTPDCPTATTTTTEGETAEPSPDAVCVYKPGMESRNGPGGKTSQDQSSSRPQVSVGDGRDSFVGHVVKVAAHVWSLVSTAFSLMAGISQV